MSVVQFPPLMPFLYRSASFRLSAALPQICLTFDDGPHPDSTLKILEILEIYSIKAVFFCVGKNAESFPELMLQIKNAGHITGNHSYSHPDGMLTPSGKYLADVEKAAALTSSDLFRPPYGRMRFRQYMHIRKKYSIFLWDIMAEDYKPGISGKEITTSLVRKMRYGSIITFHDRPECISKGLPEDFIKSALGKGYSFALP